MPSPPITIAIRGPSLLALQRLHGAGVDVGRARAVGRDARDARRGARFRAGAARAARGRRATPGSATSWRLPVEPSMMVTVLVFGRRRGGRRSRLGRRRRLLRRGARPVVAARALRRGRRPPAWPVRTSADRSRSRPPRPARRRADRRPPAPRPRRPARTARARPRSTCGTRIGSRKRRALLLCVLAERGAQFIVRHGRKPSRIMTSAG